MTALPHKVVIGLDPGTATGLAIWSLHLRAFEVVTSMLIHEAMEVVRAAHQAGEVEVVIVEDPRQRKAAFGKMDAKMARYGAGVREGVGSVKRDAAILDDYLKSLGVPYVMQKPTAGHTKWTQQMFRAATGWTAKTNEHGRDAALLLLARYGQGSRQARRA